VVAKVVPKPMVFRQIFEKQVRVFKIVQIILTNLILSLWRMFLHFPHRLVNLEGHYPAKLF